MVDSLIRLYESTETEFTTNGIGGLPDATKCTVKEERNGEFELTMTYPIDGKRYSDISLRRIILAKPNPYDDPQPFRIYAITKPINGIVTVNAEHISYDLSGFPVAPFEANNIQEAFTKLKTQSASTFTCPFTFSTDKTTTAKMTVPKPVSIRSLLGGSEGSILDVYGGGEYTFDKFNINLNQHRGANNGVSIRYGKNLTDIKQEENCSSVYTGVYPYWYSNETGVAELTERIIYAEGTYNFSRILPLDLSSSFDELPSEAMLKAEAKRYMEDNNIGVPKVSIDVSFVQLAQSKEYEQITLLEKVKLCDTVNVEFPELNVSATAKCIATEYDVLTDKYTKLSLGDAKSNLAATIASQPKEVTTKIEEATSALTKAIDNATSLITGGQGGFVLINSSSGGKQPDEILIMDTPDINTATKVWRWNQNGLGYSKNGVNGPYELAMTMDGAIVADRITTGTLSANRIAGGVFADKITAENFVINGGSINIETSKESNDIIKLKSYSSYYGTTWESSLQPLAVTLVNTGDGGDVSKRMKARFLAGALFFCRGENDEVVTKIGSDGTIIGGGSTTLIGTTTINGWTTINANADIKGQTRILNGSFWVDSGSSHIIDGQFDIRDTNGNIIAKITKDGEAFFTTNSNGVKQAVTGNNDIYLTINTSNSDLSLIKDGNYIGYIPIYNSSNGNLKFSVDGTKLMISQYGHRIGFIDFTPISS